MYRKLISLLVVVLFGSVWAYAQVKIHVIDVGQADSILLEFKKAAVLVDVAYEPVDGEKNKKHLIAYLNDFFDRRTDLDRTLYAVIITHAHVDHANGVNEVLQSFKVKYFYDGGDTSGSGAAQLKKARKFVAEHKIKYRAIDDDDIGKNGLKPPGLRALASSSGVDLRFMTGSRGCTSPNNNSLILRLAYNQVSAMLLGDAEVEPDKEVEGQVACEEGQASYLLERYKDSRLLDVDIYKVAHHASFNGTDEEVAGALSPKISLISAGKKETLGPGKFHAYYYGHPREQIVALLEKEATQRPELVGYTYKKGSELIDDRKIDKDIYCTCWDNDITVSINAAGDKIAVSPGK